MRFIKAIQTRQRSARVPVAIILGLIAVLSLVGVALAHIPVAGTSTTTAYSSVWPHARQVRVQLTSSLRGYQNMITDYDNSRGHLNNSLGSGMPLQPAIVDSLPGDPNAADVYIVEAGSSDEALVRWSFGFEACSSATSWGKVQANRPNNLYGSGTHWHSLMQMICVWPSRFSRTAVNSQGWRYQYLMFEHEQFHILNLADATDSHSSLMLSGLSMLELSTNERDAVTNHY